MRKNTNIIKTISTIAALSVLGTFTLAGCSNTGNTPDPKEPAGQTQNAPEQNTKNGGETENDSKEAGKDSSVKGAEVNAVTKIKAVTGGSPRPYVYVDEQNNATGYDIEVLKEVFNRLPQYELEIEVASFDAVFAGLTSGQYQIGVNNFSYNEKRAESYLYSYPYDKISYEFVYAENGTPITTFDEAVGKKIEGGTGVSISNAIEVWNEANPDKKINLVYTEADTVVELQHIIDGSSDFGIIDTAMYYSYVEEFDLKGLAHSPVSAEDTARIAKSDYAYYLLPLDQKQLRDDIDGVLKELQADGTLTKLGQEYQKRDDTAPAADQFEKTLN